MLKANYKKLKGTAIKKAFYLSGTTLLLFLLILLFIFVIEVIPVVIILVILAIVNWALASHIFHNYFMALQQAVIEDAFKERLKGFKLDVGGIGKTDILKKLEVEYYPLTYLPSFLLTGEIDGVKITSYSVSYKQGMDDDYIYARVYRFQFSKKPYALNLEMFDSPIISCSQNTEVKYTDRDIFLQFGSPSRTKNNIYSLFLNKYVGLDEYLERLDMELAFMQEIVEVAKN